MKDMKIARIDPKHMNGPAFDSILLAFIQIITYATNIITTKLLSVELSLTEYGTYSTVNTIITIAASFTLFGLGDSVNYYYNKKGETEDKDRAEYVNTIFFIQLLVGVAVGIALMLFSGAISDYYKNPLVKPLILIVCLKPWISNATHLYQVLFVSSGKSKLIAVRNLVISVLKVVLIYASVKLFDSLSVVFLCLVLLDAGQLIVFKYIFGKIRFNVKLLSFSGEKMMPVVRYCVPMGIYFVTTTLMREIDKLVIGRLGTTEDLAIYANCAKTLPLNILVTAFATVLIPYIMKSVTGNNYTMTADILRKYLMIGYLSVWMFSGALLLCAPEAIRFFYSSEYVSGMPIFIIYICDGMIQFASFHLVIAANGNSRFLMRLSFVLLIANIFFSLGLYYLFNLFGIAMFGPAAATLMISVVYVFILCKKTSTILAMPMKAFLPIKSMLVYFGELMLVGGVFALVKHGLKCANVSWWMVFILLCLLYCLTIALLNVRQYKQLFSEINQIKQAEL